MNFILSNDIFLKIYSFVGHNSLYFDKTHYLYLKKLRENFLKNPIIIRYKIIEWKYPGNKIILNNHSKQLRAKMKVSKIINKVKIESKIYIGEINRNNNKYEIIPSNNFKMKLINKKILFSNIKNYINSNVKYLDIYRMWTDDKRILNFKNIWIK